MLDDEERMRGALVAVERELARLDAQEEIQARVQEELGERQREMLLREQLKQIQRELGDEGEQDDVEELRERVEALKLDEEQRAEVERELKRLERTSPTVSRVPGHPNLSRVGDGASLERPVRRQDDLALSTEILDEDHYGLEDVKDRVLEFLAVRKLQLDRSKDSEDGADDEETDNADDAAEPGEAKEAAKSSDVNGSAVLRTRLRSRRRQRPSVAEVRFSCS